MYIGLLRGRGLVEYSIYTSVILLVGKKNETVTLEKSMTVSYTVKQTLMT